jgi:hypothetical protein
VGVIYLKEDDLNVVFMDKLLTKLIVAMLLLLVVLAPFAGLAPLMGVLLIVGLAYVGVTLLQTLVWGESRASEAEKRDGERG